MKEFFKKIIPSTWLLFYHFFLSQLANWMYWFPSKKMFVIGVTGTNGKSTTVDLIARILEEDGHVVGSMSTVSFRVGREQHLNSLKMTMPGRFFLQKMLRKMVKVGCKYAVIETSSEGILQHRHLGVHYDMVVFTNLTPEHLEAHGGFDNYKKAKLRLPFHLQDLDRKILDKEVQKKYLIANLDDRHALDFLDFEVDEKWGYSIKESNVKCQMSNVRTLVLKEWSVSRDGIGFRVQDTEFKLKLLGMFDLFNAAAAITCGQALGIPLRVTKKALEKVRGVPGRMEKIDEGQDFTVMVDYAPEPFSMKALYDTIDHWSHRRTVHVLGSTGGGRDKGRRPILGYIAGSKADLIIVTNEDPYDDDPKTIIDDVAFGALEAGKDEGVNLFKILDRREAIRFALSKAEAGDLVIVTGKGSEQAMVIKNNKKIPWDDRTVVHEELKDLQASKKFK